MDDASEERRHRLEGIGLTFLAGYHAALDVRDPQTLAGRLNAVTADARGFAFEGAAMALALLDYLTPWSGHRWRAFATGIGAAHIYMVHVGAGWALARLHRVERPIGRAFSHPPARFDPLLGWLMFDGYGFHEGYFHWDRYVGGHERHQQQRGRVSGYARRAFDQGLGRSIWFIDAADVRRIPVTIDTIVPSRHADLWSGVGLACAYAGGADDDAMRVLWNTAGEFQPQLAQGAAFAATARVRAGNVVPHTATACQLFCGLSPDMASRLVDRAAEDLPPDAEGGEPAYEVWRRRIQSQLAQARRPFTHRAAR